MDALVTIGILLILALLVGTVLSFVNIGKISELKRQIGLLGNALAKQNSRVDELQIALNKLKKPAEFQSNDESQSNQSSQLNELTQANPTTRPSSSSEADTSLRLKQPQLNQAAKEQVTTAPVIRPVESVKPKKHAPSFNLEKFLMGNGLLWLGALILAIGGVFLAKYSIESGLFPPQLRILLGAGFGLALVAGAEFLYRNPTRFQINTPVISAALASGGVITCFAMVLVAFDFYDYLSPTYAFVLLAIIALASAWLSLRLGPILAGIGVIGAYAVPALVSTGSNNVLMLLLYVSAVSFSAVWIHQIVQKAWIWWLGIVGHFGWFLAAIWVSSIFVFEQQNDPNTYQNIGILTVFAIVSVYLFVLLPVLGWNLKNYLSQAMTLKQMIMPRKEHVGILLPLLGMMLYALLSPFGDTFLYVLLAFSALLLIAPTRHSAFDTWPFLAVIFTVFVYCLMPEHYDYSDNVFPFTGGYLLAQISAFTALLYAFFMLKVHPQRPAFALLLVASPLSILSVSYALSNDMASSLLYPLYAIELGFVALVFAYLALREKSALPKVSYLLLANGALSLTFTMLMSASTLTLALAVQIALMATFSKKYALPLPTWLYKIAMFAVLLRLTFAPWLPEYSGETLLGVHWTIIIYPLVFAVLWYARKQIAHSSIQPWFSGALLHLVALFITTETSYLLTGAYPNLNSLTFEQSTLLAMNWLILGMLYLWRRQFAGTKMIYTFYASVLFIAVGCLHLSISGINNPFLSVQPIGTHPVINYLIALWLIPALSLLAGVKWRVIPPRFTKLSLVLSGVMLFLYINATIRLAFHPGVSILHWEVTQAELYTYSIIWLLIALAFIVFAKNFQNQSVTRLGFGILAVVVLKAFLIDMDNLEGLYRALSFIGLGLSLVGIGWLFQRFKQQQDN